MAWLTEQQYGQTVPPTDRFGTVTTWLSSKTNEDTLENTTPLSEYFPNGPLGQIYAIDIVAVAEKPFQFFVYVPYNRNAQPVVIDVPRDAFVRDLCVQIRDDELLKDYVDKSLKLYKASPTLCALKWHS